MIFQHRAVSVKLLKNILLVMKAGGILLKTSSSGENSLWEETWIQVNKIAPLLQAEVFPDIEGDDAAQGAQNRLDIPPVSEGRMVSVK
ncbi:hypothetical protein BRADI_3g10777v3 [Brachypodium distachyon]|uniref:Uncharacterized protein n=1 Tax=Brachypodium distachyon TaxID=15368 RepID=I1HZP7_BRADI|nr:hypothetical protein BRADI_3g10777v3 [Brachypodium distachyon]